jgi:hypothetical protein
MWIFLKGGFFSIVQHRDKPGILLVRGRNPEHFESIFPNVKLINMTTADYPWRAEIPHGVVARTIAEQTYEIDYTNFKSDIDVNEPALYDAMIDVWRIMSQYGEPHRKLDQ